MIVYVDTFYGKVTLSGIELVPCIPFLKILTKYHSGNSGMPFFLLFPDLSSVQCENEILFSLLNNYFYILEYSYTTFKHFKCRNNLSL